MTTLSFVAGAKSGTLPEVPTVQGNDKPVIEGEFRDYIAKIDEKSRPMMQNKVKKCPGCEKPNGFTLAVCNSCGTSLKEVPISFTTNVFVGFMLGIEKGGFPYTISIRHQDDEMLLFDDLLALSPLHFNAIPTKEWIPDWRYLLRNPRRGLEVTKKLHAKCVNVADSQFLSNAAFVKGLFKPGTTFTAQDCLAGFNFPPSQYQLHVQFMCPVLMPHQRYLYQRGVHFTKGRFFPISYVVKCLEFAAGTPLPMSLLDESTDIGEIVKYFVDTHALDYDKEHAATYEEAGQLYEKYANWANFDFEIVAPESGDMCIRPNGSADPAKPDAAAAKKLIDDDKAALQNYGRPYKDGKPRGTFYSFPKAVGDIGAW